MGNLLGKAAIPRLIEKEQIILRFLHQEIYSNHKNLSNLLGISPSPTYKLLRRMVKFGLLEKHVVSLPTGDISIWGITNDGIEAVPHSDNEPSTCFLPSRVSPITLKHTLMNQKVSITLKQLNWTEWTNADRLSFKEKYKVDHRPDAIVTPNGRQKMIAIETELTFKSPLRYRQILKSHILAKEKGYWSQVLYVVLDDNYKNRLLGIFKRVKYIEINGSRHPIESYLKMFPVFTIDELKNIKPPKKTT